MEERQTGVAEGTLVHASQGKRTTYELAPRKPDLGSVLIVR
jgi:hypothetical protein